MSPSTKYTVLVRNGALGTSRYVGTFDDQIAAETYAASEAARTRKFVSYEVWSGTPKNPRKPTDFVVQGVA
jgi:hypothetical protein